MSSFKKWLTCVLMMAVLVITVLVAQALQADSKVVEDNKAEKEITDWYPPDTDSLEYYGLNNFETKLPVLYVNTDNQQISKTNKIWAALAVAEFDGMAHSVMYTPDWESAITIKYRGASSYAMFDKKQYRIKFYKEKQSSKSKEYEFLGMGKNSEWGLNGPFLDKTLLRNKLVYDLGRKIFEWAPDSRFVELFIDGEYQGVYLAVEPVTNGESRLRLCEFGLLSGETAYIVKRDRIDSEDNPLNVYGSYAGKTSNGLFIDYPTGRNITDKQRKWITKDIDNFERVLYSEDFADPDYGYPKYIDVDNFVDYVVLNEVVMNRDAGNLSTYIYKELGGKLQIAIWDYNNCFDNYQWFAMDYEAFVMQEVAWFSQLMRDRAFVDKVVARYQELRQGVLAEEYLCEQIDNYVAELGDAVVRNYAVWGYSFYDDLIVDENELHMNPTSYEEAIEQLKKSIHKRLLFLDGNIGRLYDNCVN